MQQKANTMNDSQKRHPHIEEGLCDSDAVINSITKEAIIAVAKVLGLSIMLSVFIG